MGLITGLLTLPLAPVRGTIAISEQVLHQAEEEYYDPGRIRAELAELDRMRETGELPEEEIVAREDALVEMLMTGTPGGGA